MQPRITPLNTERKEWSPQELADQWQHHLQEHDRSAGTVKKYTQAVARFLTWYEREEQAPLQLSALTPITLIGYRNHLQHEQRKSINTINLQRPGSWFQKRPVPIPCATPSLAVTWHSILAMWWA